MELSEEDVFLGAHRLSSSQSSSTQTSIHRATGGTRWWHCTCKNPVGSISERVDSELADVPHLLPPGSLTSPLTGFWPHRTPKCQAW